MFHVQIVLQGGRRPEAPLSASHPSGVQAARTCPHWGRAKSRHATAAPTLRGSALKTFYVFAEPEAPAHTRSLPMHSGCCLVDRRNCRRNHASSCVATSILPIELRGERAPLGALAYARLCRTVAHAEVLADGVREVRKDIL